MKILPEYMTDILIIGSGIAGLSLALRLSQYYNIKIISKNKLCESSTLYAQGGIAAVFDKNDSEESHINDTIIAGSGICNIETVKFVVNNARHCVEWLIKQGINFDTKISNSKYICYHLNKEGGHSFRRILHKADITGKEIENILSEAVKINPKIHVLEKCSMIDLIISRNKNLINEKRNVLGAYICNLNEKTVRAYFAKIVVLATGGASQVYRYTTNPDVSSGDGISVAWRAGCRVANLEFNQFHPTCLFHPKKNNLLLTEALRGEGAYLLRPDGSRFMLDFDERAELAPRDIVSRTIDLEMKRLKAKCMYLDISHKSKDFIIKHFPNIYNTLLQLDIDLTCQKVPIVPAAHYTCGGIVVDQNGRTDIDGLYAIGEVSYTGLHGANRLASNSLLECLVYSWSSFHDILKKLNNVKNVNIIDKISSLYNEEKIVYDDNDDIKLQCSLQKLRKFMWENVGIVRTTDGLVLALNNINLISSIINNKYSKNIISKNLIKIRNLIQVAELICISAIKRKESIGLHFSLDYPNKLPNSKPTILIPKDYL